MAIGELAIMYPLPSAFPQWTKKFVDTAPAFTVGWAYWLSHSIILATELTGLISVLNFWTTKVPAAGWISIFFVVIILVNACAVRIFGEIEVVMSSIKFLWIFVVIISCIVISAGGAPNHTPIGFKYWDSDPFPHSFKGFLSVMPTCIFAMGGTEIGGLAAAEARNPRVSVPRGVNATWLRLGLFYVLGALMVTICVSPTDKNLFGSSGSNASPFVIAYRNAGLPAMAHLMNVIIFISVLSSGNAQPYLASRTVVGLAHMGMAPKIFMKCDSVGRPWASLALTLVLGGGLSYLNVSSGSATVFTWLSHLTSLCTLYAWGTIFLCHIRFRTAWKVQGRSPSELPWKSWSYPFSSYYGFFFCIALFIIELYLAISPLTGKPSASTFFANYMSAIFILVVYVGSKFYYRGPLFIKASKIDLDTDRRFYPAEEEQTEKGSIKTAFTKFTSILFGDSGM